MTDNEKRAHDLAIAISVPKCFKEEEILRAEKKDGNVDYWVCQVKCVSFIKFP